MSSQVFRAVPKVVGGACVIAAASAAVVMAGDGDHVPDRIVPTLVSPRQGSTVHAAANPLFMVKVPRSTDERLANPKVFLTVAAKDARETSGDEAGVLKGGSLPHLDHPKLATFYAEMTPAKGKPAGTYSVQIQASDYDKLKEGVTWVTTPGKYYWQAFVVNCNVEQHSSPARHAAGDCAMESKVHAFTLLPPAAGTGDAATTTP